MLIFCIYFKIHPHKFRYTLDIFNIFAYRNKNDRILHQELPIPDFINQKN